MGARLEIPEEAWGWMTAEIRALLVAIKPPHVAKKRRTVIKLAFARANEQPVKDVFAQDDVCSEQIWYANLDTVDEPERQEAFNQDLAEPYASREGEELRTRRWMCPA